MIRIQTILVAFSFVALSPIGDCNFVSAYRVAICKYFNIYKIILYAILWMKGFS
jgi:hypothetical protein